MIMTVYSIQRQINLIEIRDTRVLLVYLEILVRFTTSGSEERGVLGVGSIHAAIFPSCQYVKDIAL